MKKKIYTQIKIKVSYSFFCFQNISLIVFLTLIACELVSGKGWHCVMDNISLTVPFDQRPLPSSSSYQCSTYEREIRRSIDKKGGERTSTTNDEISKWSPNNDDENGDESTAGSSNNNNYLYPQGPNGPCYQNL